MIGIGFAAGMTLAQKALRVGIMVAAVAALLLVSYCTGRSDGRSNERLNQQVAVNKALERDRKAREKADAERVQDMAATAQTAEDLNDAIDQAVAVGADPAVALACQRLRALPASQRVGLPAECGPEIGN